MSDFQENKNSSMEYEENLEFLFEETNSLQSEDEELNHSGEFEGKFRREFRNALEKCRCGRVRVEDRSLYHSTPATRINNISPSSRSNYQLTSLRDMNSIRDRQTIQTSFIENGGNGHPQLQITPMLDDRAPHLKYDHCA